MQKITLQNDMWSFALKFAEVDFLAAEFPEAGAFLSVFSGERFAALKTVEPRATPFNSTPDVIKVSRSLISDETIDAMRVAIGDKIAA